MKSFLFSWMFLTVFSVLAFPQLIVDHTCTNITIIPESAINQVKDQMHIAYGHTSHGSQLTTGLSGLVGFANNGGRGLSLPENIFLWNNGGTDGALDLHDYAMDGDVGYWPQWYDNTVAYLDDPANSDVNVIMWSWCGQVGSKYSSGVLWEEFLEPMSMLEQDYPNVTFVYMTGHLDYWNRENVNAANDSIRSFCLNNNKVLFDFADIESYSPDGTCYKDNADDACDYYNESGDSIGNWAIEYQNTHTEGVDWYTCGSAHSQPLNANLKAYAAWWMFASLGGWNYNPPTNVKIKEAEFDSKIYPVPSTDYAYLDIEGSSFENLKIDLISANGTLIESGITTRLINNKLVIHIDTSSLESAVYYILVTTANTSTRHKLLVVH